MTGSSTDGREQIKEQITKLQNDIDSLLSNIIETQTELQGNLLKWADFDEKSSHLAKWLKDTEKILSDTSLRSDFPEKKLHLHKMKVLF